MELNAAQNLCEDYRTIYEEKFAENYMTQEKYFLNELVVVHLAPFNETSYEVVVNAIKDGKIIVFKLEDTLRLFGDPL